MGQLITCTSAGVYPLTRGQQYELLGRTVTNQYVRVRDDNGRRRWFRGYYFDLSGGSVPVLASWRFDDPVVDPLNGRDETYNWVDIRLKFDDGTQRWCQMATPDYLKKLVDNPLEPMICARNLVVARDLREETVEQIIIYFDQQGELMKFSLPIEPSE